MSRIETSYLRIPGMCDEKHPYFIPGPTVAKIGQQYFFTGIFAKMEKKQGIVKAGGQVELDSIFNQMNILLKRFHLLPKNVYRLVVMIKTNSAGMTSIEFSKKYSEFFEFEDSKPVISLLYVADLPHLASIQMTMDAYKP